MSRFTVVVAFGLLNAEYKYIILVVIKLQGGLGNQMFQYAAAKCLAINTNSQLYIDTSFLTQNITQFDGFTPRAYELGLFSLKESFINPELIKNLTNPSLYMRILSKLNFRKNINFFYEESLQFNPLFFQSNLPVLLNGFFQSQQYFKSIKNQLFEIFTFPCLPQNKSNFFLNEIRNTVSVAVHVRRGDYVTSFKTNAFHGVCDEAYYHLAIQEIKTKIGACKFFFFSDDHNWVMQNLIVDNSTVLVDTKHLPSWYDMYLMTQCKHNIIANSSYSWWGAWLNRNNDKVVVAPNRWFVNNEMNEQVKDLIPAEWIKL
jgi:hypothetical protein